MSWAITVRFLRGVCVATSTGQWDETEWPIHPARLFMAMAAAHFETNSDSSKQKDALQWLESQPPPQVLASAAETRKPVTVFVPVNDSSRADQLLTKSRSRQPRFFPTSIPHNEKVHFVYNQEPTKGTFEALEEIVFEITRIGHSSSLTQVWIEQNFELPEHTKNQTFMNRWSASSAGDEAAFGNSQQLRIPSTGMLKSLEETCNLKAVTAFAELSAKIQSSKGAMKKKIKQEQADKFPDGMPTSLRPKPAHAVSYSPEESKKVEVNTSCFDSDLMILTFINDCPVISLESTLQLTGAVRKRLHDAYPDRISPEWLGGHQANGKPTKNAHVAILPLSYVGSKHADGHLLGLALAFPREIPMRTRAIELKKIFETSHSGDRFLKLNLHQFRRLTGNGGNLKIELGREQRLSPPRTLISQTWTKPCRVWESVTPIVLDRFPKKDRLKEREQWNAEVAAIISKSCNNIGLPRPSAVHVHHNAFLKGAPKARPKGGGFPPMPIRDGNASRFQIHARIEFDTFVEGPVILGAGRFNGYGFCRPNSNKCKALRSENNE